MSKQTKVLVLGNSANSAVALALSMLQQDSSFCVESVRAAEYEGDTCQILNQEPRIPRQEGKKAAHKTKELNHEHHCSTHRIRALRPHR
jgi:hypothetical protein